MSQTGHDQARAAIQALLIEDAIARAKAASIHPAHPNDRPTFYNVSPHPHLYIIEKPEDAIRAGPSLYADFNPITGEARILGYWGE